LQHLHQLGLNLQSGLFEVHVICVTKLWLMKKTIALLLTVLFKLSATAQVFSMVEINPLHGSEKFLWSDSSKHIYGGGEFASFAELNGKLYFTAQNGDMNYEVWVTDGTQQGTQVLKEINTTGSANPGKLHKVGNKILFAATDDDLTVNSIATYDLFVTDGTESGTLKLADLNDFSNDFLSSSRVISFNNKFVFCTSDKVMTTDGTIAGTAQVGTIQQYAQGFGYCELNGKAYFLISQNNQLEVWRTDGTSSGTMRVKTLSPDIQFAENMKSFNGKLYIVGAGSGEGYDLFSFDGTETGSVNRIRLSTLGYCYPSELRVYENKLWLIASNDVHNNLYKMDVNDVAPIPVSSISNTDVYGQLAFANGNVYINDQNTGNRIIGINTSTLAASQIDLGDKRMPWLWPGESSFLVGLNNQLYFIAYDSLQQQQYLMISDGTTNGTRSLLPEGCDVLHPFNALLSCGMADAFDFTTFNNKLVMPANFNNAGRELWFLETESTSVLEETSNFYCSVFPNPANQAVNIILPKADNTSIELFDLCGKKELSFITQEQSISFSTNHLSSGTYLLRVSSNHEVRITQLVIQH